MNKVSLYSLLIMGVSMGFFSMSYLITNYILDAQKFSFLGYLPRPFGKFVINNSLISWVFLITYIFSFFKFQFKNGIQSSSDIFIQGLVFTVGHVGIHVLIYLYFMYTNKDIVKLFASNIEKKITQKRVNKVNVLRPLKINPFKSKIRVESYFDLYTFKFHKVNPDMDFDKTYLVKVFDQNHLNAAMIQFLCILLILFFSLLKENPSFQIPAGASIMIMFSIFVTVTGFISYWFRNWALSIGILFFLILNYLVAHGLFDSTYKAFGLNYQTSKKEYTLSSMSEITSAERYSNDTLEGIKILNNWKNKFDKSTKPKLVLLCASGGGQRAAVWTLQSLQVADSLTKGNLFKNSVLMTGASGGMIGLSYFRELKLREYLNKKKTGQRDAFDNISKDVLNPVAFSLVVNDLFFRIKKFQYGSKTYEQDRGYAFENQLNKNTDFVLDKKVIDYQDYEQRGIIPMVIMSPTILNDGRKLHICAQDISYMSDVSPECKKTINNQKHKSIEFRRFFQEQDADSLSFTTALRMSATFPYITPNVKLPSEPEMEIMDAGLSDNFGFVDALRFTYVFKNWIEKNTSGVVLISMRDSQKEMEIEKNQSNSIIDKLFTPVGSLYQSWDYMQDLNNDNLVDYAKGWLHTSLDVVDIVYDPRLHKNTEHERASLSWHLTSKEKASLQKSIFLKENLEAINKINNLLK
ncbi:MAG: patatin-like phospholipase family protein [Cytophagales bacterium]